MPLPVISGGRYAESVCYFLEAVAFWRVVAEPAQDQVLDYLFHPNLSLLDEYVMAELNRFINDERVDLSHLFCRSGKHETHNTPMPVEDNFSYNWPFRGDRRLWSFSS